MDTISIIIVSFNGKDIICDCIDSIFREKSSAYNLEIIVVDNASSDGSVAVLRQKFPHITIVENNENMGFAKANNVGLKSASGNYIFLLNPDTIIKDDAITKLWQFCKDHSDAGIAAPKLFFEDGSLQPSVYQLPTIFGAMKEYFFGQVGSYSKYAPNSEKPIAVEAVVGAAMMIPRSVIEQLGKLFDEKFYFYYEDIDLCRRMNHLGKKIYYLPEVQVVHLHGTATQKRGDWAYKQNQKSAEIYFGAIQYFIITMILKFGQKWQRILK